MYKILPNMLNVLKSLSNGDSNIYCHIYRPDIDAGKVGYNNEIYLNISWEVEEYLQEAYNQLKIYSRNNDWRSDFSIDMPIRRILKYNHLNFIEFDRPVQMDDHTWAILTFPTEHCRNAISALKQGLCWDCKTNSIDYAETDKYYPSGNEKQISNNMFDLMGCLPEDDPKVSHIINRMIFWKMAAIPVGNDWKQI